MNLDVLSVVQKMSVN